MADPIKLVWVSVRDPHTRKVDAGVGTAYDEGARREGVSGLGRSAEPRLMALEHVRLRPARSLAD